MAKKKKSFKTFLLFFCGAWLCAIIVMYIGSFFTPPYQGIKSAYGPWEFCGYTTRVQRFSPKITCVGDTNPALFQFTRSIRYVVQIIVTLLLGVVTSFAPVIGLIIAKKKTKNKYIQYGIFTTIAVIEFYIVYRMLLSWVQTFPGYY